MCRAMTLSPRPLCLETALAPDVNDVIWRNMPKSATRAEVRGAATSVAVGMLAVFWTIAIQLCFTLSSLSTLKSLGFDWVESLAPGSYWCEMRTDLLSHHAPRSHILPAMPSYLRHLRFVS